MGRFLTIGYCSRTIGYCYPYCFLEIFVGEQGFDGGRQNSDGGGPFLVPCPLRKTLWSDSLLLVLILNDRY